MNIYLWRINTCRQTLACSPALVLSYFWAGIHRPHRVSTFSCSSVQSKMVSTRSGRTILVRPISHKFSPLLLLRLVRWTFLGVLWKTVVQRVRFLRLSLLGDRLCGVLGFVPACNVSNSSTLQTFWDAGLLWRWLCPPISLTMLRTDLKHRWTDWLISHLPLPQYVLDRNPGEVFKDRCRQ